MSPHPYTVGQSDDVRDQYLALLARADAEGRGDDVRAAAAVISNALKWMAEGVGESRSTYRVLGEERAIYEGDLTVVYVVDRANRLVYIRRYALGRGPRR